MVRRVAVVTDSISDEFFFPLWRRYYGGLFGEQALPVIAYECGARFADPALGGVLRLPAGYEDGLRARVISDYMAMLLHTHDVVVRVDMDEFLVADPREHPSLRHLIEASDAPLLTAGGGRRVPDRGGAAAAARAGAGATSMGLPQLRPEQDLHRPPPAALGHRLSLVRCPPVFGPLFMLHLKRVGMVSQLRWGAAMTGNITDNPRVGPDIHAYYRPDEEGVTRYHLGVSMRPRLKGIEAWYRDRFQQEFAASVALNPAYGLYMGRFGHEEVLCEIPAAWRALL